MAERHPAMHGNMAPLSKLKDYEVADDSIDVRGWAINGSTGADIGRVKDLIVDPNTMQARYLVVSLKEDVGRSTTGDGSADPVLVPVERAQIHESSKRVHLDSSGAGLAGLPRYRGDEIDRDYNETFKRHEKHEATPDARHDARGRDAAGEERMTRSAEELRVGKRRTAGGEARVRKHVETERVSQPVTKTREEAYVERRPVSGRDTPRAAITDDEVRIPLTAEEVTVEKRPVVKEELVVGKRQVTETEQVEADLRKEKVEIDQPGGREHYGPGHKTRRET